MKKPTKPPFELTGKDFMKSPEIVAAVMLSATINDAVGNICASIDALNQAVKHRELDSSSLMPWLAILPWGLTGPRRPCDEQAVRCWAGR